MFRNPLVSPFIQGVSSGAGHGAALGILLLGQAWMFHGSAFLFGCLAVCFSYALSRMYRTAPMLVMGLAGVIVGACYLLFIDDLARTVTAGEIPLGILTATVGAPVFALVLRKSSLGWSP